MVYYNSSLKWLEENHIMLPRDLQTKLEAKGVIIPKAIKQADNLGDVSATYHDAITQALTEYMEGGSITSPKNQMKQAVSVAFLDVFELGWQDGGAELPLDEDGLAWLGARQSQEFGYIDMLFQEAKELRKEEEFDFFAWVTARADGYTNSLKEVYNNARVRAMPNIMVTFDGDDGEKTCDTCAMLKGKRHRISWFVKNNYVPPFGSGLDCAKGGHCKHGLKDDKENWITI